MGLRFELDIDEVVVCLKNAVVRAVSEEDVRVWVSKCLEDKVLAPLGVVGVGRYEYTLISGARVDALYGHVVIEYKAPGRLATASDIQRAKQQVIEYIKAESGDKAEWRRYLGVIVSDRVAFVRYDPRADVWVMRGPYDIRREVVVKLVEALRGLRRKPLDASHLIDDFGLKSPLTKKAISVLYRKLVGSRSPRARLLFDDWRRLFTQATGYRPEELEELPVLARELGLSGKVNFDALIFSSHTYYAFLMKLMAAEIVYLYGGGKFYRSYISELDDAFSREGVEGLRKALAELEGGGVFRRLLNIENFLEGDYFSWYLDELDGEVAEVVAEVSRRLSDYEIATPQLEPEFARDLLKRLYQNLVPGELRHRLGEYYTPDWLANLLLDEVGLSYENILRMGEEDTLKPLKLRVLDPACGSGTFLVLYISRLRRYAEERYLTDVLLGYLLTNVVGYDLNPLAVLTARTNYLLAVADLLAYVKGSVELPVYLSDSIMIEGEEEKATRLTTKVYVLRTSGGIFFIPVNVVERGLLPGILAEVSRCLENRYSVEDFVSRVEFVFKLDEGELSVIRKLYEDLLKLELEGRNRVWVAIIRNAFAPIAKGVFDYVVGNPPWVNWENLPESYREVSSKLWDKYGLTEVFGKIGLGKVKRDLSMLFLARCFERYLREGGSLGFLIPFTVFKTQAGAGFRKYLATKTKIRVVHDLVTLYPFEGAVNRTAAVVVEKVGPNELDMVARENLRGVKHVVWVNPSKKPVPTDKPLDEVLRETRRYEIVMVPMEAGKSETTWMQLSPKVVSVVQKLLNLGAVSQRVKRRQSKPDEKQAPLKYEDKPDIQGDEPVLQYYDAHAGVYVGLNQVYYVRIKGKTPDGRLVITNPPEPGQKKSVKQVEAAVEPDLVYPLVRGRDVKKWWVEFKDRYIILPVRQNGETIPHLEMKTKYPGTYDYFHNFLEELVKRSGEPYKTRLKPYRKSTLQVAEQKAPPFYWVFNAKPSLAPYKVVWKRIAGAITGKAVSFACAVITPINGKPVIVDDSTILVNTNDINESYYLAGFLNSLLSRTIIASYSYELRQETHIADFIKIPKFDPQDKTHNKIAELSKRAHELSSLKHSEQPAAERYNYIEKELEKVEGEINLAVAELFGLSLEDLREFEKLMAILSGEEPPAEPEEVEPVGEPIITISNTLLQPNTQNQLEIDVTNTQGTMLEINYDLPWETGTFKIVEGKHIIQTPPLKPGKYQGRLEYTFNGVQKTLEITIEVMEQAGPKRRKTLQDIG
jgi:type II restriction/modification system DNA methylase subunit YeeA